MVSGLNDKYEASSEVSHPMITATSENHATIVRRAKISEHARPFDGFFCAVFGLVSAFVFLLGQNASGAQVIQTLPFYDSFDYNPGLGLSTASTNVWTIAPSTSNIQVTNGGLTLS